MASWLINDFNVSAKSFKDLGFETSEDYDVYKIAAKKLHTIIITTKDIDFTKLSNEIGPPPKILYLNVGNISNKKLKEIIYRDFKEVIRMFAENNHPLIEISKL